MRTLLLISFWVTIVGVVVRLALLSIADYPRLVPYTRIEDAVLVVIGTVWICCLAVVLW